MVNIKNINENLKNGSLLSCQENNDAVYKFLESKRNGAFGRLVYEKNILSEKTALRLVKDIQRMDEYFKKPFSEITEDDIIQLRDDLNSDKIKKKKTSVNWKKKVFEVKISETKEPWSYATKMSFKSALKMFFNFYQEYQYQQGKDFPDVMRFFILKKSTDFKDINVDYMTEIELNQMLSHINNPHFKALVQLSVMSGARPVEALNIKLGQNLYRNQHGKWVIHLPKVKRISYMKYPFEIDLFEEDLVPYFDKVFREKNQGDFLFDITSQTFGKLMRHYSNKYVGRTIPPKVLRKTARMFRINSGYSESWINKLMGHAPGSKVVAHYTNYSGVENDSESNDKLKARQLPGLRAEYDRLKNELNVQKANFEEKLKQQHEELISKLNSITGLVIDKKSGKITGTFTK